MSLNRLADFAKKTLPLLLIASLSACAVVKQPLTGIVVGREVETLESSVSVTVNSGEHSTGGRGVLVYKRPDRFHLAVLSPFGLTVLEVFSDDDRITCLVPSRQTAYSGLLSELPETSALKSLALMKWVMATPPPPGTPLSSKDRLFFDRNGLLARKVSVRGDEVLYEDYRSINGVAFPESVFIGNLFGSTVKIVFDEPQINQPVEESALVPSLEGIRVLPLSQFKGL